MSAVTRRPARADRRTGSSTLFVAPLLAAALVAALLPPAQAPAEAASCPTAASTYAGGDGTSGDPFLIETTAQLLKFANTSGDWVAGTHFRQTDDISLTGCDWPRISTFNGSYDGGGHEISGLTVQNPGGDGYGFVQTAGSSATFVDILLVGVDIDFGTTAEVGALAGVSDATISGVSVSGIVKGGRAVGGLVGDAQRGSITDSSSSAAVTGGRNVGGLVGFKAANASITRSSATGAVSGEEDSVGGLVGANNGSIEDSFATGTVGGGNVVGVGGLVGLNSNGSIKRSYATGAVSGTREVGGLIGASTSGSGSSSTTEDSFATGAVSGTEAVGGLIGAADDNGAITRSYAVGAVSGTTSVGGLVGRLGANITVTGSFWDTTTSGQGASAGGAGKTTAEMKAFATFGPTPGAGWPIVDGWEAFDPDVAKVWGICAAVNEGYPFLLWQFTFDRCNATAPAAPSDVTGLAGDGQVTVSWTAPDDGGSAITGYTVTAAPGGETCTVTPPATSCVVSGLTNGTAYTFTVIAANAVGDSLASAPSAAVTPTAESGTDTDTDTITPGDDTMADSDGVLGDDGSSQVTPVLTGGAAPVVPVGSGVWQLADGTQVPLTVSSPGANQLSYAAEGITVTLTGGPGTSVTNGLVVNPAGEVVCEVCLEVARDDVIEVWLFSTPRLIAAHRIGADPCQTFAIPVIAPLDGGGPVSTGAHTLQLALPTASGMQAVNVGVTVGGPVPASVPAGEGPAAPAWMLAFGLLATAGSVLAARRQVAAG